MIYITGDIHANIDIGKLSSKRWPIGNRLNKSDFLIICGDFGLTWDNSNEIAYWRSWLNDKSWTTLWVDGNHENFDILNQYPVSDWNGGKVHLIEDSIIHLMRGQIYNIDGYKFFTMGGARSHDKCYRKEGLSWWPGEMPSKEEYNEAMDNLEKCGKEVDFIISHCAPSSIMQQICSYFEKDDLTNFFENYVKSDVKFKYWFFGHYHTDKDIGYKYSAMYDRIVNIAEYLLVSQIDNDVYRGLQIITENV